LFLTWPGELNLRGRYYLWLKNWSTGKIFFFSLELIYLVCRDGLLYLLCGNESLLIDRSRRGAGRGVASPFELEEAMALLQKAVQELSTTNVNRRLTLEGTLLQLQRRFALCPR